MTTRKRQEIVGVLMTILASLLLIACSRDISIRENKAPSDQDEAAPQSEVQKSDSLSSSEEGLLELELIGYVNAVESFNSSSVEDLREMINSGESFFLYVGRPTCEWCRKVAPALQNAFTEFGINLYYLDSTNTEVDTDLQSFRERFEIDEVPSLLKFENGYSKKLEINLMSDDMNNEVIRVVEEEL